MARRALNHLVERGIYQFGDLSFGFCSDLAAMLAGGAPAV